jgi:nucleotide-binding universal stress UspA family protein
MVRLRAPLFLQNTHIHVYEDYVPLDFVLPAEYATRAKKVAQRHLDALRRLADAAGVGFTGQYVMSNFTADAIVKAARKYRCDTIVMASRGRRGIGKLLLGSETQKVLVSAKVPVLVTH